MGFRVAMILDRSTDFSHIERGLSEMGVELWLEDCKTEEGVINTAQSADFIITIVHVYPFTRNVLKALKRCKFIETLGVGYDGIDLEAAYDYGIGVINNNDYHIEELSEHTLALMLASAKRIFRLDEIVKGKGDIPASKLALRKTWYQMVRVKGKTLGLVGFGRIARAVAAKARSLGMRIVVYDPYVSQATAEEFMAEKLSLEQLLAESDFVSIHAILTPETHHLIGPAQFKMIKRGAHIINTARGAIIDEAALCATLAEGTIAGAALDVTDQEPPAPDNPLMNFDNVILTGHSGHSSPESWQHRLDRPLAEIARVMRGEWPIGLINPEVKGKYTAKWGEMHDPSP
ncbi:C-terminal binding protein [Chloroflexota bacterium]